MGQQHLHNSQTQTEKEIWVRLRRWLIDPASGVKGITAQRQASFLSALLFGLAFLIGIRVLVGVLSGSIFTDPSSTLFVGLFIITALLYGTKSHQILHANGRAHYWQPDPQLIHDRDTERRD